MICHHCRAGADLQQLGETSLEYGHRQCRGGSWCACQHRPVSHIPAEVLAESIPELRRLLARPDLSPDVRASFAAGLERFIGMQAAVGLDSTTST